MGLVGSFGNEDSQLLGIAPGPSTRGALEAFFNLFPQPVDLVAALNFLFERAQAFVRRCDVHSAKLAQTPFLGQSNSFHGDARVVIRDAAGLVDHAVGEDDVALGPVNLEVAGGDGG